MSAGTVAPLPDAKHVRVCFDGVARPLAHQPNLLRVEVGSRVVIVDTADKDVLVEYPEPPRTWTDGDVICVDTPSRTWAATREAGEWWTTAQAVQREAEHKPWGTDATVDGLVLSGNAQVLRYQHGEA